MPTECNYNVGAGGVAETIYLLDSIATAATAGWSTRKIRSAYAGSCLRVRRTGDNVEQDIGFGADSLLDTVTLLSFVDAGGGTKDGFVVTWYDQSGNARDITNATAAKQPQISDNGVLKVVNSNPALEFTAANLTQLASATAISSFMSASEYTVMAGIHVNSFSGSGALETAGSFVVDNTGFWSPILVATIGGGGESIAANHFSSVDDTAFITTTSLINYVTLTRYNGTALSIYLNGGAPGTDASAGSVGSTGGSIRVGSYDAATVSLSFDGLAAEILINNVSLSNADVNTLGNGSGIIKGNMTSYNGTSWTAI